MKRWLATTLGRGLLIRNKFEQCPVGVAKINTHALTFGAEPPDGSQLHRYMTASQMRDRGVDRPLPFETQIAVAGLNRQPCYGRGIKARTVHIELCPTEPVRPPRELFDEFGTHHLLVEGVATCPVGHVNHTVVERYTKHLTLPFRLRSRHVNRASSLPGAGFVPSWAPYLFTLKALHVWPIS